MLLLTVFLTVQSVYCQFNLNGNAVALGGDCYRLTQAFNSQVGTAWAPTQISLNNPFDLQFDIYLGCSNSGADGLVFGLQPVSTSAGGGGSGIGFGGITPSVGVEFDTYQNGFDPAFDHCALITNGNLNHTTANTLAGPVQINPNNANVEDCNYHRIRVTWDPLIQLMEVYYGCTLRLSHTFTNNIVTTYFSGNPNVYWGFTSATGGFNNEHRFCIISNPFQSTTQIDSICAGDSVQLTYGGALYYQWNTSIGLSNDTIGDPFFSPNQTDTFSLLLTDSCGNTWNDTAIIHVEPNFTPDLGNDSTLCPSESITLHPGQSASNGYSFLWNTGAILDSLSPSMTNTYIVTVTDSIQVCSNSDTIDLVFIPSLQLNLGNDSILCDGDQIVLNVFQDSAYYLWQNGSQQSSFVVDTTGLFYVTKYSVCDTLIDSIYFDSIPIIQLDLGNDTLLCQGQQLNLTAINDSATYQWNTSSTNDNITVTTTGQYMVTVTTICEVVSDTVNTTFVSPPVALLPPDDILCAGDDLILTQLGIDSGFVWSDGSTNDTLLVNSPGTYHLTLSNFCGSSSDTIHLTGLDQPQIELGNDTNLCPGQTLTVNAYFDQSGYQWSNGDNTSTTLLNTAGTFTVTVTNFCGFDVDSIKIEMLNTPTVQLPNDTTLCPDETYELIPFTSFADSFLWSTGETDSTLMVLESGKFTLTVRNQCGSLKDFITVNYYQQTALELGTDTGHCSGDEVPFLVTTPANSYLWSTGEDTNFVLLPVPGTYFLTIVDTNNCLATDFIEMYIDCPWTFFVPNAFTPNNDGRNDSIGVSGINLFDLEFSIFDRWGNALFTSTSTQQLWDGKVDGESVSQGVYVWRAIFKTAKGTVHERFGKILVFSQ